MQYFIYCLYIVYYNIVYLFQSFIYRLVEGSQVRCTSPWISVFRFPRLSPLPEIYPPRIGINQRIRNIKQSLVLIVHEEPRMRTWFVLENSLFSYNYASCWILTNRLTRLISYPGDSHRPSAVRLPALGRVNLGVKLIFFQFLKSWVPKICLWV